MLVHRFVIAASCLAAASLLAEGDARAGALLWSNGFEGAEQSSWWFAGNAGVDAGIGLSHGGASNGWARNYSGWNAVNTWVSAWPGSTCEVGAWIRSSSTLTDGYMSIRSADGSMRILNEVRIVGSGPANPSHAGYNFYSFNFVADGRYQLFYAGLWGNGQDSWLQVDDVYVYCPTPYPT
ncbi:hypothetical protein [Sorangium sp. So ce131]|uniref:hypothetical protein n=1 Tax=Sorangium sp. So ce131 TaxID=3133282 RepID=UPI003F5FB058